MKNKRVLLCLLAMCVLGCNVTVRCEVDDKKPAPTKQRSMPAKYRAHTKHSERPIEL